MRTLLFICLTCISLLSNADKPIENQTSFDLLAVYQLAKENDATYRQAYANYQAQREIRKQAKAAVLPSISLDATESETEQSGNIDNDRTVYSATLTQTLFDYRIFKGIKQAKSIDLQAEADLKNAQQNLILRTARAYFNVLIAQDNLRFARAEKNSVKKQLDQTKQRYDIGLVAITDYKEAQANYDLSIAAEILAENVLRTANEALYVISNSNIPNVAHLQSNFPLNTVEPQDTQYWVNLAFKNNPTLLSTQYQAEASKHAIGIQGSNRFPSINLSASRNYTEDNITAPSGEYDTTLALNFSMPLFSGGGTNSKIRQAQYNYESAYQALLQQKRLIVQQTRDAYQNVQAAISRSNALAKALDSTKAALDATEAGYKAGTRTTADVLEALRNVYQSESNYAEARYSYILNRFELEATYGNLSEQTLEAINHWFE